MVKKVFVTVGTTLFEKLISVLEDEQLIKVLSSRGYSCIVVQHGKGRAPEISPQVLHKYNSESIQVEANIIRNPQMF